MLVARPGPGWPQVVASMLEACEVVVVRPPGHPPLQIRRRLEGVLRRSGGVLVAAGEWEGAPVRLRVARRSWAGIGDGYGSLRACRAEIVAEGRGAVARPRRRWLWLPAPDGTVAPDETADAGRIGFPAGAPAVAEVSCERCGEGPVKAERTGEPVRILAVWCPGWPEEDPGTGARAFERVVTVVEDFCPEVEVLRPGMCVLAARGPARYFGGEDALARKIAAAVADRGFECHAGVAGGHFAACLAARAARPGPRGMAAGPGGRGAVVPPGGTRQSSPPIRCTSWPSRA